MCTSAARVIHKPRASHSKSDGIYTSFLDDLYITSRSGIISSLAFEVEL